MSGRARIPIPPGGLAIAHRAGNSIAALREAEAYGADMVELDVRYYFGRAEVRHLKTIGPVPIYWDRWHLANPFRRPMTLETLLAAASPSTILMLDLKADERHFPQAVIEIVDRVRPGLPYAVCSQKWFLLDPFLDLPHVQVLHSAGNERARDALPARLRGHDAPAISIHQKLLTAEGVARLRDLAPLVASWPVNDLALLERLRGWGVNGFISDNAGLLAGLVAARQRA
jgi:glycerophosphoryl diester phosphodiesterase